ncbi:MAG: extracellular solute-binding protein [Actinomycetaceae bacterium]|nr:extracellular solute-binding protein [Arcanobacterium sp.]MDD7505153.1 extracellular solute-binding protein [Actinomycetaceae bacterium]
MKKSIKALTAAVVTSTLALAGCSNGTSSSSGATEGAAIPQPKVSCDIPAENFNADPVDTGKVSGEITWMTQGLQADFKDYFEGAITKFEEQNPGTTVNWIDQGGAEDFDNLIATQAQGCQMADVINVPSSTIMALSARDFLMDLDVKAPELGANTLPDLFDSTKLGNEEHHTAVPWYMGPPVTLYNTDVLERNGLDPATPPATVEDLFSMGKKVAEAGNGDYMVWGNPDWQIAIQWTAMGVKIMDDEATEFVFADDNKALEWLTGMAELNELGVIPPDSFTGESDPGKEYNKGKLVIGTPNPGFVRNIQKNNAEVYAKTEAAPYPVSEGGYVPVEPQYIAVSSTTGNAPLAVKFAEFITSDDMLFDWARNGGAVTMTTSQGALDELLANPPEYANEDPVRGKLFEIMVETTENAKVNPASMYLTGKVKQTLTQAVVDATQGKIAPADALQQAQDQMNELVKSLL